MRVLQTQRLWIGQRDIVGEFRLEPSLQRLLLVLQLRDLLAQRLDPGAVLLAFRFRHLTDQQAVAVAPQRGRILVFAHQGCDRVATGGEPHAELLHRRRRRGLHRPLRRRERFARKLRRGTGGIGGGEIGDVLGEIGRALLDQPAGALLLAHLQRLGRGMVDDGDRGLARIVDRGCGIAVGRIELRQRVERARDAWMVGPERGRADVERALQQLLGFRIFLFRDQRIGEVVLDGGDDRIFRGERLRADLQRLAQIRFRLVVLHLLGIGLAAVLQEVCDVGMVRAERAGPDRDDLVQHRDHPVIGLAGVVDLAALGFGIGLGAVEHGEVVDAVAAPGVAQLARGQLLVDRERAFEQRIGFGEHVLVEVDAAEIVERRREIEVRPVAALLQRRDRRLQHALGVGKAADIAVEIAELRLQDSGDLVVGAEARFRQLDGFFGKADRSLLVARDPELPDPVIHRRKFALLRGSISHRKKQGRQREEGKKKVKIAACRSYGGKRGAHRDLEKFRNKNAGGCVLNSYSSTR